MASWTPLSERRSLEIGNIKVADVTRRLMVVLTELPACKCPFIPRLVQISRGSENCTFPQYAGGQNDFPFIVHDCMETALPLRAHRMGELVDHGRPDNTT